MADLRRPSDASKYIDLSEYSQVNASNYMYQLPVIINNLSKMIGNNVVLKGLNVTASLDGNNVVVEISDGVVIQNHTLIEIRSTTELILSDGNVYDVDGKFAVYIQYQYLNTVQDNPVRFGIQHIAQTGISSDGWDHNRNATVLTFFDFTKDVEDDLTSITESTDEFIEIDTSIGKKNYYKYGLSEDNIALLRYVNWFLDKFEVPTGGGGTPSTTNPTIITDDVVISEGLEVGGDTSLNGENVYIAHDLEVAEDLTIQGIFKAQGERILLQSDDVEIDDREIMLNANELNSGVTGRFAGLRVNRGSLPAALLLWDEEDDTWRIGIEGGELTVLNWGDTKLSTYKYESITPSVFHTIIHNLNTQDLLINIMVQNPVTGFWQKDLVGVEYFDDNIFYVELTESSNVKVSVQEVK